MGDTFYLNCFPFTMDDFDWHVYIYYFNGINTSPGIQINFNSNSYDTLQGNNFLHNFFGQNYVRLHK